MQRFISFRRHFNPLQYKDRGFKLDIVDNRLTYRNDQQPTSRSIVYDDYLSLRSDLVRLNVKNVLVVGSRTGVEAMACVETGRTATVLTDKPSPFTHFHNIRTVSNLSVDETFDAAIFVNPNNFEFNKAVKYLDVPCPVFVVGQITQGIKDQLPGGAYDGGYYRALLNDNSWRI